MDLTIQIQLRLRRFEACNFRYIFASAVRSIRYSRIRMQSVHCVQNRVGTTSILTFGPSVSVSYVSLEAVD
jgi:hypothetical protein